MVHEYSAVLFRPCSCVCAAELRRQPAHNAGIHSVDGAGDGQADGARPKCRRVERRGDHDRDVHSPVSLAPVLEQHGRDVSRRYCHRGPSARSWLAKYIRLHSQSRSALTTVRLSASFCVCTSDMKLVPVNKSAGIGGATPINRGLDI